MMRPGRFMLLLVLAAGNGVACNSKSDLLKGRDGGAGTGAAGTGGVGGGAGTGGATAGTGGGGGGVGDPIIGMPLATFDTTVDGFILYTSVFGLSNNATERNVGGYTTGLPRPDLSHDPTAGSPTPGSLKLSVPFTGTCCEFAQVQAPVGGTQDWSDRILHARVRVASGNFAGIAQLFIMTPSLSFAWGTARVPLDGNWHELTLDVGHAPNPDAWGGTQVVEFGVAFNTGLNIGAMSNGMVVFQIDSFSLEKVIAPPDGGTPDVPPDGPSADIAPDRSPGDVPPADGGFAKDQFVTALTNARCSYLTRCGLFTSLDSCVASTSPSQYNLGYRYMLAAVDRGVSTYDPAAAATCVAGIADQACLGLTPTSPAACSRIFSGAIPLGGACIGSGECAPAGSEPPVCVPITSGGCAVGTCSTVEVIAAGGSCVGAPNVLRRCADGTYCKLSTSTCVASAALGQVCESLGTSTCGLGQYCAYDQTVGGNRCFQPAAIGEACPPPDITGKPNCASLSDYCATSTKTCTSRVPVGGACTGAICVRTAYCDGSICRAQKGPAEICGSVQQMAGQNQCAGDLTCVQTGGTGGPSTCSAPPSGDICPPPS